MTRKTAAARASLRPEEVQGLFMSSGALLEGHFLLSSGLHSARYLQSALVLADPQRAERLGAALARLCQTKPDLVVSPALGGLIIGQETARALKSRHIFTEREDGRMTLRRGFAIKKGEKVLLVEDVITTGKSSGEVVELIRERGGKVTAAVCLVDRTPSPPSLGVPVRALLRLEIPTYRVEDCPQCAQGLPFVKPGSRTAPR